MSAILNSRTLTKLLVCLVTLFSIPLWTAEKPASQISYLYIMGAKDGHIEPTSADGKQGTLVLYDISKSVFFFSDRPNRQAGKMDLAKFLAIWSQGPNSFKKDHPNAGLVFKPSGKSQTFTSMGVELSQPQYDASNDRLTFTIQVLDGEPLRKQDLGEAMVYIDDIFGMSKT